MELKSVRKLTLLLCVLCSEQWEELGAGEPGREGPAAQRHRHRHPKAPHPAAGPRLSGRQTENIWRRKR